MFTTYHGWENDLKSKLFGSSGARGIINVDLTPVLISRIGSAIVTFSKAEKILLGHDTRVSSLMVENALVSSLVAGGAKADCLGVVTTPILAYLTKELKADVGIMITASHNPPQYNGIKIFSSEGMAYTEEKQNEIERIVKSNKFRLTDWRNLGEISSADESNRYIELIRKKVKLDRQWHVVIDPGCGATCHLAPALLESLGCKVTTLNAQPDGFFPGRSPEPSVESLKPLTKIVQVLGMDAGIAYDGDGDRVAFVDEDGFFIDFDQILAAYATHVVKRNSGGIIVTNVEASMCVEKMVNTFNGEVIRARVGDVYVSEAMKKYDAFFGGEPCGAWIHPQFHYCPDGVLSSVLLLKALEDENKELSEFISEVPQYETLRENVVCRNEVKYRVMEKVKDELRSLFPTHRQISTVDGVRLSVESGWILVRASGTEPVIRLTVEGESSKTAKTMLDDVVMWITSIIEGVER